MTPDEWANLFNAWNSNPDSKVYIVLAKMPTEWAFFGEPAIEHPTITSYFDHLYAQELGIQWP